MMSCIYVMMVKHRLGKLTLFFVVIANDDKIVSQTSHMSRSNKVMRGNPKGWGYTEKLNKSLSSYPESIAASEQNIWLDKYLYTTIKIHTIGTLCHMFAYDKTLVLQ